MIVDVQSQKVRFLPKGEVMQSPKLLGPCRADTQRNRDQKAQEVGDRLSPPLTLLDSGRVQNFAKFSNGSEDNGGGMRTVWRPSPLLIAQVPARISRAC